jgi:hypothetical protein
MQRTGAETSTKRVFLSDMNVENVPHILYVLVWLLIGIILVAVFQTFLLVRTLWELQDVMMTMRSDAIRIREFLDKMIEKDSSLPAPTQKSEGEITGLKSESIKPTLPAHG